MGAVRGNRCYCGRTLSEVAWLALPASRCTRACAGDASETRCGGGNNTIIAVWNMAAARGSAIGPAFWPEDGAWCPTDNFVRQSLDPTIPATLVRASPIDR
jgi:hypothetical protein